MNTRTAALQTSENIHTATGAAGRSVIGMFESNNETLLSMLESLEAKVQRMKAEKVVDLAAVQHLVNTISDFHEGVSQPREKLLLDRLQSMVDDFDTSSAIAELKAEHSDISREANYLEEQLDGMEADANLTKVRELSGYAQDFVDLATDHIELQQETILPAAAAEFHKSDWQELHEDYMETADGEKTFTEKAEDTVQDVAAKAALASYLGASAAVESTVAYANGIQDLRIIAGDAIAGDSTASSRVSPAIQRTWRQIVTPYKTRMQWFNEIIS